MESIGGMSGVQMHSTLMQVLRALEAAIPAKEVALSLHAQALKDAALRSAPAMDLFTEASRDHLAAMVASAGYIRRIMSGDNSRAVWVGLQSEIMSLNPSFAAARDAFREMMNEAAAKQSELIAALGQVLGVVEQGHSGLMRVVQPLATVDLGGASG